jgi:hypothetical protein
MPIQPKSTSIAAAVVYVAIALFCGASAWLVLAAALPLDNANRDAVVSEMLPTLWAWVVVCVLGVLFAVIALRFGRFSISAQRFVLVASCIVGGVVGIWLEWWQALYFVLPAVALAFAFRGVPHA